MADDSAAGWDELKGHEASDKQNAQNGNGQKAKDTPQCNAKPAGHGYFSKAQSTMLIDTHAMKLSVPAAVATGITFGQ